MATYTDNYQLTLPTYAETADIATINNNMTKIDEIMHDSQLSIATAYDASTTSGNPYNTGDIVMYEKIAYRCKYDGVYGTWDASKWEQTTLADNLGGGDASEISYDNTTSGLTADDVQEAIDELEGNIEDVSDGLDDAVESLAPAYDSAQTYDEGDIVSYQNKLYECNTDNTTGTWDAQYWDEYIISENMGASVSITPETIAEPKQKIADFEIDGVSGSLYAPIVEIEGHASGAIATFTDGGDNKPLKSLKVAINPVQASGTPTPSNPLPISGWTGANISVKGKNLVKISADNEVKNNGNPSREYSNNGCAINVTSVAAYYVVWEILDKITPAMLGDKFTWSAESLTGGIIKFVYTDDWSGAIIDNIGATITITNEMVGKKLGVRFYNATGTPQSFKNGMVEHGSSASSFEPYNAGTLHPITWSEAGTVYVATITIINGKVYLTKLGERVNLGDLTWTIATSGRHNATISRAVIVSNIQTTNAICEQYKATSATLISSEDYSFCLGVNNVATLQINDSRYNNEPANDFKSHMNGVYLMYYYATPDEPIEIGDLTIDTLLGNNNIWSDTGDIDEVIYIRDLNLALNELWDLVHSNSGTRSLFLSKSAVKEEETKEESKEEPKEEEETKEEQR